MKVARLVFSVILALTPIMVGCAGTKTSTPTGQQQPLSSESKQVAEAAIDEFYALDSRLKVGLSFIEYGNQLPEVQLSLDRLERSAGLESKTYKELSLALEDYQRALTVWKYCIDNCVDNSKTFEIWSIYGNGPVSGTEQIGPLLTETYKVPTTITEHESLWNDSSGWEKTQYKSVDLNTALTTIWTKAGERIGEGEKGLKQTN